MPTYPPPEPIARLSDLSGRYDAILCDVWGVIHNGRENFPAACAALVRANTATPVVLISNAPRPATDVIPQLRALGVPDAAWSGFVTSGDATRAALRERVPGPVWTIGPARDDILYEGLGLDFARGPHDAGFISCTGMVDDEVETPEDYRVALAIAAERGLEFICANPDRVVHRGERLIYCAGALADLYDSLGGATLIAGKPAAPIYDLTMAAATEIAGHPLDRARVLTIGDGLITDVAGANAQGLDLLYIAGGIDGARLLQEGGLHPQRLADFLDAAGAHARYAMAALA